MLNKPRHQSVVKSEAKGKSLPKSQRGSRTKHFCHHCGLQGHTRPNCHKLRALKNASDQSSRGPRNDKRNWAIEQSRGRDGDSGVIDVMKMIDAFTTCLASFSRRFEGHNTRTQSYRDITPNARDVGEKGYFCVITYYVHALILLMFRDICSCIFTCIILFVSTTSGY